MLGAATGRSSGGARFYSIDECLALERQPEPRKKLVALLLAHNADTCRSDKEGYSCLHWASACGAKDCIAALLEAGAKPTQRCNTGETALHRAARLGGAPGRVECLKLLAAAGGAAAITTVNNAFHTPLDVAGKVGPRLNVEGRANARRAMLDAYPEARTVYIIRTASCI